MVFNNTRSSVLWRAILGCVLAVFPLVWSTGLTQMSIQPNTALTNLLSYQYSGKFLINAIVAVTTHL